VAKCASPTWRSTAWPNAPDGWLLSRDDFAERLKPRRRNTHKGSFGNAGVLGGAKSDGRRRLSGRSCALKLGAGRVYVGLLDGEAPAVDLQQPELMLRRADVLLQTDLQALACGPGLGRSSEALRLLEQSLKAPVQLVLDADALNLLADDGRLEGNLTNRVGPAILTRTRPKPPACSAVRCATSRTIASVPPWNWPTATAATLR
jgi:NAD(P)H-hydrate repair Nnr-like enzyme with NAD(P)H-hydrate dehydratase domain